jgi:hypothetical protein
MAFTLLAEFLFTIVNSPPLELMSKQLILLQRGIVSGSAPMKEEKTDANF